MHQFHRRPLATGAVRPWKSQLVIHFIYRFTVCVTQSYRFPIIAESAFVSSDCRNTILSVQRSHILRHNNIFTGAKKRRIRKNVRNACGKVPAGHIYLAGPGIIQLDELRPVEFILRFIVNLIDDYWWDVPSEPVFAHHTEISHIDAIALADQIGAITRMTHATRTIQPLTGKNF